MLRDLFGPQRLIRDGILPPEVLYRHPGFRLPFCRGPKCGRYAACSSSTRPISPAHRTAAGGCWPIARKAPAAPASRWKIASRFRGMLPDVSRQCGVERLAPYFIAVKEQLARLAPKHDDEPRIVLLSQAAGSINYFEDAFLARYLGYPLAEAGDLAVRRNRLYLKSLAELSPVNVLVAAAQQRASRSARNRRRRRAGNRRFAAGRAVRQRRDRQLAGQRSGRVADLSLVPATFCRGAAWRTAADAGRCHVVVRRAEGARSYVLERLDELIVRPAYRRRGEPLQQISQLAEMSHKELTALINSDPAAFVAHERIVRSGAPSWTGDQLQPSYIALRTFAVAQEDGYKVMPGGLARVSTSLGPLELSLLDGERSKDAWVLADAPVAPISLLTAADEELPLRRGGIDLSSRAAEHFFWLGRHSVRAESLAKLLRSAARRLASEEQVDRIPELPHLLRVLAEHGQIEPGYVVEEIRKQLPAIEKQLPKSAFDDSPPGALRTTVNSLVALAATVRELMSLDMWRTIRQMSEDFRPTPGRDGFLDLLDKLDVLLVQLAAFAGEIAESMTRTYAWRFLDLGRRVERGLRESQLIRGMLAGGGASEPEALEALVGNSRQRDDVSIAVRLAIQARSRARPVDLRYDQSSLDRLSTCRMRRACRATQAGLAGCKRAGR